MIGWSPDYTEIYSQVVAPGSDQGKALIVQSTTGGRTVQITPYVANAEYFYAGESKDGSVVLFESSSPNCDPRAAASKASPTSTPGTATRSNPSSRHLQRKTSPPKAPSRGPTNGRRRHHRPEPAHRRLLPRLLPARRARDSYRRLESTSPRPAPASSTCASTRPSPRAPHEAAKTNAPIPR